jgi:hypothetical protein
MVGEEFDGTARHSLETEVFAGIANPFALAPELRSQHALLSDGERARKR